MVAGPTPEFGCTSCWPSDAAAAWEARAGLVEHAMLIDDSHLIVSLRSCPACGQHFVSVFLEFVDWVDGDDPQYWTLMPLTADEVTRLQAEERSSLVGSLNGLAPDRRCLQRDYPKGQPLRLSWGAGILITG